VNAPAPPPVPFSLDRTGSSFGRSPPDRLPGRAGISLSRGSSVRGTSPASARSVRSQVAAAR